MSSVTRLYLIRHGSTVLTAEDRFAGASNVALSDEGRAQAAALADRLNGVKFAAIYASPLDRTMETATILAAPHHLTVQSADGLREMSHGRWEGMSRSEVLTAFPDEVVAWDEDPYMFAPEGAESGLAVTARALPTLMNIYAAHRGGHIAIVSHKATIRLVISSILGFDPRRYRDNLDLSPCALSIVDVRGPTCFRLALFNDTSHYSQEAGDLATMHANRLSPHWSVPDASAKS